MEVKLGYIYHDLNKRKQGRRLFVHGVGPVNAYVSPYDVSSDATVPKQRTRIPVQRLLDTNKFHFEWDAMEHAINQPLRDDGSVFDSPTAQVMRARWQRIDASAPL